MNQTSVRRSRQAPRCSPRLPQFAGVVQVHQPPVTSIATNLAPHLPSTATLSSDTIPSQGMIIMSTTVRRASESQHDNARQKDDMMRDLLSSAHAWCVSTFREREEVHVMAIVGGFDIHRRRSPLTIWIR
jgi:hypothetical protein